MAYIQYEKTETKWRKRDSRSFVNSHRPGSFISLFIDARHIRVYATVKMRRNDQQLIHVHFGAWWRCGIDQSLMLAHYRAWVNVARASISTIANAFFFPSHCGFFLCSNFHADNKSNGASQSVQWIRIGYLPQTDTFTTHIHSTRIHEYCSIAWLPYRFG